MASSGPGTLPTRVVSGQPIASAWGNSVVDRFLAESNQNWTYFNMSGPVTTVPGAFDLYVRNGDVLPYARHVTVIANWQFGFNGAGAAAVTGYMIRMLDGAQATLAQGWAAQGQWTTMPGMWAFSCAAGQTDGFKCSINHTTVAAGGNNWQGGHGAYLIRRLGADS